MEISTMVVVALAIIFSFLVLKVAAKIFKTIFTILSILFIVASIVSIMAYFDLRDLNENFENSEHPSISHSMKNQRQGVKKKGYL